MHKHSSVTAYTHTKKMFSLGPLGNTQLYTMGQKDALRTTLTGKTATGLETRGTTSGKHMFQWLKNCLESRTKANLVDVETRKKKQ